jgi:hypothetical protein
VPLARQNSIIRSGVDRSAATMFEGSFICVPLSGQCPKPVTQQSRARPRRPPKRKEQL